MKKILRNSNWTANIWQRIEEKFGENVFQLFWQFCTVVHLKLHSNCYNHYYGYKSSKKSSNDCENYPKKAWKVSVNTKIVFSLKNPFETFIKQFFRFNIHSPHLFHFFIIIPLTIYYNISNSMEIIINTGKKCKRKTFFFSFSVCLCFAFNPRCFHSIFT